MIQKSLQRERESKKETETPLIDLYDREFLTIPQFNGLGGGEKTNFGGVFCRPKTHEYSVPVELCIDSRIMNSLIGFSSDSLVFCERKSDLLVKKSESLPPIFCNERPEQIALGRSFLNSKSLMVAHERF